jgi:ankyrin repeat protein
VSAVHPVLGLTPLHVAAFAGNKDCALLLLAKGAPLDVPSRNEFHNTPLILSVLSGQEDVAAALLAKGANIEAEEEAGVRPIHLAAELGDVKMLGLLLDHHAGMNARTGDGKTALGIALERGRKEAASLLRARGAE